MQLKRKLLQMSLLVLAGCFFMSLTPIKKSEKLNSVETDKVIYLDTIYSFEERAIDLVSRLTLEEKQSLLGNQMAAIPRLGINAYQVWGEALHGLAGFVNSNVKEATSFPNGIALGASWDPALMERQTSMISDDARGSNYDGIVNLTYWSPVVEPVRDPRWGRTAETFGEDPFLISQIAGGFIRGMMGNDPVYLKTVPCGKHFLANNCEIDRHVGSSNMDDRDMREFYLAPYKKLIEKDKLPSIMTAYNAVNGVPVSASKYLVDTIARKLYGLNGYVTGDCNAVKDILVGHHYAKNNDEAAAYGLKTGVDSDCGKIYQRNTISALKAGLIREADIDRALFHMFTIRMRLGEFDPKNKVPYTKITRDVTNSLSHTEFSIEVGTKTPVLLKNSVVAKTGRRALPLKVSELKKIAVIGPKANVVELGPYSGKPLEKNIITPLSGIKTLLSNKGSKADVLFSPGANTMNLTNLFNTISFELEKADGSKKSYDVTKYSAASVGLTVATGAVSGAALKGFNDGSWVSYKNIDIVDVQSITLGINVCGEGGTIEIRTGSVSGSLLASFELKSNGSHGSVLTRTVSTKVNQLGLTASQDIYFVFHAPALTPIDKEAIQMASSADVAIVFVGTDDMTATEELDRATLSFPGNQLELIKKVAAVNPNTVVVIQSLGMLEVEEIKNIPNIAGIIWVGYNGEGQGASMARILFGDANPGGKLNTTWFKSIKDLPAISDYSLRGENDKNGRTYWYFNKDVSYEFGYGLSYTSFEYSNLKIDKTAVTPNDKITVSIDLKNTGAVDGDEVVQVYLKTPDSPASLQRPIKRLKGFQRVTIPAGKTQTVTIPIDCADLWFWDSSKGTITFDKGKYVFEIGASSKNIKGRLEATMSGYYKSVLKTVVAECGKFVFKIGDTAKTTVTAAMSNDSFYDISKAKITYKSNKPAVASVSEKGLITAKGAGVATIITYVTIDGKTLSNGYTLKVMPGSGSL